MLPATAKQKELIADILTKIPDAKRMHEYHDYVQRLTRENASEFITQALENNLDIIAKKKTYMGCSLFREREDQYPDGKGRNVTDSIGIGCTGRIRKHIQQRSMGSPEKISR